MTIRVEIHGQPDLEQLAALLEANDVVLLTQNGEIVAETRRVEAGGERKARVPGALAHLGPMDDPFVFSRPDETLKGVAEAGEDYKGPSGKE